MTLDELFASAIQKLDPNGTIPDEDNYLNKSKQFKAPDHAIFGGQVLIERKTRVSIDDGQFATKLNKIAQKQGTGLHILGQTSSKLAINQLPDAQIAMREFGDYFMNQTRKTIGKTRKKFDDYKRHVSCENATKLLVISDHSFLEGETCGIEHALGILMGAYNESQDVAGCLDAIIYAQNPQYVWDRENGYWFISLVREYPPQKAEIAAKVSEALHNILCSTDTISPHLPKFSKSHFRTLWV